MRLLVASADSASGRRGGGLEAKSPVELGRCCSMRSWPRRRASGAGEVEGVAQPARLVGCRQDGQPQWHRGVSGSAALALNRSVGLPPGVVFPDSADAVCPGPALTGSPAARMGTGVAGAVPTDSRGVVRNATSAATPGDGQGQSSRSVALVDRDQPRPATGSAAGPAACESRGGAGWADRGPASR